MTRGMTMSCLGKMGRFGNQLFQYGFGNQYAAKYWTPFRTPPWVGENLFPSIPMHHDTPTLPRQCERYAVAGDPCSDPVPPTGDEFVGKDAYGYFQFHTSWFNKVEWQAIFPPNVFLSSKRDFGGPLAGRHVVGLHYRAGDFNNKGIFWRPPIQWYRQWLLDHWGSLKNPMLVVVSEDRSVAEEFADFDPWTPDRLGVKFGPKYDHYNYEPGDLVNREPHILDFFAEWSLLAECDTLLIPNSTFSFTAAMSNRNLKRCYRANLAVEGFEEVDPWDAHPLDRRKVEDYAGVLV